VGGVVVAKLYDHVISSQNEYNHKERQLTQQLQVTMDTLCKTEAQVKQLQGLVTMVMMMSCDAML